MIVLSVISTKGGVGKTTLVANLSAVLAHMGFRVLMVDADIQPALSKYFPISKQAPHGLTRVVRDGTITADEVSEITIPGMTLDHGERPVLDLIYSDSPDAGLESWLMSQGDRVMRLKYPLLQSQYMRDMQYDFVIIDTRGAISALQDAAVVAGSMLLTPVVPEALSAREFLEGTSDMIRRLSRSAIMMNIELGLFKALINRQTRTVDAKSISSQIRGNFIKLGGKVESFDTVVPMSKAYTEAATRFVPVHLHDPVKTGASPCAYEIMHRLVYELVPHLGQIGLVAPVDGADLSWLPSQHADSSNGKTSAQAEAA